MSSPSSALALFPFELLSAITAHLSRPDLLHLSRTSRLFQALFEPFIWIDVELHYPYYHDDYAYKDSPRPVRNQKPRPYLRMAYKAEAQTTRTTAFLRIFGLTIAPHRYWDMARPQLHIQPQRAAQLAAHVRSLCCTLTLPERWGCDADTETAQDPWSVFAQSVNLEALELNGRYQPWENRLARYRRKLEAGEVPSLGKLRRVKLRGYFPAEFVRWVCGNPGLIEDLELAVLACPVGGLMPAGGERANPPGKEEHEGERRALAMAKGVAPRAVATLLDTGLITWFTSLRRLSLARPSEPGKRRLGHSTPARPWFISQWSERRILEEWKQLIAGTRRTLEELVLDQRHAVEGNEADRRSPHTSSARIMAGSECGNGHLRFSIRVSPTLVDREAVWPKLKSINLYGFDVPEANMRRRNDDAQSEMPEWRAVSEMLGKRFPKETGVDIVLGLGCWMPFDARTGSLCAEHRGGDDDGLGCLGYSRQFHPVPPESDRREPPRRCPPTPNSRPHLVGDGPDHPVMDMLRSVDHRRDCWELKRSPPWYVMLDPKERSGGM